MTLKQLAVACEILWGKDWQEQLADVTDTPQKTVALWARGDRFVPVPVQTDIKRLLERKRVALDRIMDELDVYAAN